MTEIPEHLLKRSKERRSALGLGDDSGGEAPAASPAEPAAASPAETAPAPAPAVAAATPATPEPPPPPKQVPASVQAFERRRRIPFWAMPVVLLLPVWGYLYQGTLEEPAAGDDDPVALGGQHYAQSCASCHGASGGGGAGPALTAVTETWPDFRDHVMWVRLGSQGWPGDVYGAQGKPKQGGMPAFGALTDQELAQIVLYEREVLGGEDPANLADLLAVAMGEKTFAEVGLGELSEAAGVDEANLEGSG